MDARISCRKVARAILIQGRRVTKSRRADCLEPLLAYHVVLAVQAFARTRRAVSRARIARPGPLRCDVGSEPRRQFACVKQESGHEKHDRSTTTSD